ncbi:hypothetical protein BOTBODRAFT_69755 [Botryobasidium botryosum FD-172 SS1]|uniref:ARID domain-containing protein n=1 Tax=Botryobasidium botryosum (strain FD-172 SS1) TaxID=930990 RepID=A0A067M183_BOTB1|nr:hypothetical protein BOTBODRAFT_69755 [Botryobasidium botryosum FD-172 SS1]
MNPSQMAGAAPALGGLAGGGAVGTGQKQQQMNGFPMQPPGFSSDVQRVMQQGIQNGVSSQHMMQWLQQNMHGQARPQQQQPHQSIVPASVSSPLTPADASAPSLLNANPDNSFAQRQMAQFQHASNHNMDANMAKQMAALSAAARSRNHGHSAPPGNGRPPSSSGAHPGGPSNNHGGLQGPQSGGTNGPKSGNPRLQNFYRMLGDLMIQRNTPLPPALTGVNTPSFDPLHSPFRVIETTGELGVFRLAGVEIDLHEFFMLIFRLGGSQKVTQNNQWEDCLAHFRLPQTTSPAGHAGPVPTVSLLQQYHNGLLGPFEDWFFKQQQARTAAVMRQQQQQQQQLQQQALGQGGPSSVVPGVPSSIPHVPGMPPISGVQGMSGVPAAQGLAGAPNPQALAALQAQFAGSAPPGLVQGVPSSQSGHHIPSQSLPRMSMSPQKPTPPALPQLNPHIQAPFSQNRAPSEMSPPDVVGADMRKRKLEDQDVKRVRRKTEGENDDPSESSGLAPPSGQPARPFSRDTSAPEPSTSQPPAAAPARRHKIEYLPLQRPMDTYGGRDLGMIEAHMEKAKSRRAPRGPDELGQIDIEGLIMSLRSRLGIEVSYALTTFTLLSTMTGAHPGQGFPLHMCEDLLEVLLDFLEEEAFEGDEDEDEGEGEKSDATATAKNELKKYPTHQELIKLALEEGTRPFAGLDDDPRHEERGLRQRPSDIILTIMNLLRNFSMVPENQVFMSRYPRTLDVVMRACAIVEDGEAGEGKDKKIRPASRALSLPDLVKVRSDALQVVANLAGETRFVTHPAETAQSTARGVFLLASSFLVDPSVAISPLCTVALPMTSPPFPPAITDLALEAFSRIAQPDNNRQIFAETMSHDEIFTLFDALLHMLPVVENDFSVTVMSSAQIDPWMAYMERIVLCIYDIAFLAPPPLKRRIRKLPGLTSIVLRMIKFYLRGLRIQDREQFASSNFEKNGYAVMCRRVLEALRLLDDGEDEFARTTATALMLPMRGVKAGKGEDTMGLLSGEWADTFFTLLCREGMDETTFAEVEKLVRVGSDPIGLKLGPVRV